MHVQAAFIRRAYGQAMDEPDDTLLRLRAVNDANQLMIDHGAMGDAEVIEELARRVERCNFPAAYTAFVVAELRARAALVTAVGASQH